MTEPLPQPWVVRVEERDVLAAEASFARILVAQNRALRDALNALPIVNRRVAFRVLQILGPIGLLGAVLLTIEAFARGPDWLRVYVWMGAAVLFATTSWWAWRVGMERADAEGLRVARGILAGNARRIVERTAKITPFTARYSWDGDVWVTRVDEPALRVSVHPERIGVIAIDGPVCCLFRRRWSQRWCAVIWLTSDATRAAVEDLVARVRAVRPDVMVARSDATPQPRAAK